MQNQIPKNWQKVRLGELLKSGAVLEVQDGNHGEKHPKQSDYVKEGDRIPFIMANDLSTGNIDFKNCSYIKKDQADKLRIGFSKTDDVLLTHKGNLGLVSIVPKMPFDYIMLTPQVTYYRTNKNRLYSKFLKYAFLNPTFQKDLLNISPQSTRPYVGITAQRDLEIYFIEDIKTQEKIASILSTLDDKIEVNNKIAKTLEEMAQTLFKEWFVNFKLPVYGKAEFIDSELGSIPKGWKIGTLKDLVNIRNGFAFKSGDYRNQGVPIVRTMNFTDNGSVQLDTIVYLSAETAKKYENFYLEGFDFLLVMVGASVGKWSIVPSNILPALQNQNMWDFMPKKEEYRFFNIYLLKKIIREQKGSTTGSARDFFRKDYFYSLNVFIPDSEILQKFNSLVELIYRRLDTILSENQKLAALRDLLLPKLMKGEIGV